MQKKGKKYHIGFEAIALLCLIVIVIAIVLLLSFGKSDNKEDDDFSINGGIQVSGIELIRNKDKYENVELTIKNVLVSDPLFAYIEFPEGGGERLFIEPRKSEYCLYFNLNGELKKDDKKDWLFHVNNFECVSRT